MQQPSGLAIALHCPTDELTDMNKDLGTDTIDLLERLLQLSLDNGETNMGIYEEKLLVLGLSYMIDGAGKVTVSKTDGRG